MSISLPSAMGSKQHASPLWVSGLVLLLGILLSIAGGYLTRKYQQNVLTTRFEQLTREKTEQIRSRMHVYVYGLLGLRGAVLAADKHFDRMAFERYAASRNLQAEFPGMLGYGLIRRLPASDINRHLQAMQAEGLPSQGIRQLGKNPGDLWVITYLTPLQINLKAIGLDIASEEKRRQAIRQAISSGRPALSAPITLVQADRKYNNGFLLMLPVYRSGSVPATLHERTEQAVALTYAPLLADNMLFSVLRDEKLELTASAMIADSKPVQFFSSREEGRTATPPLARYIELSVLGQRWQLHFRAGPRFLSDAHMISPWLVMLLGMMLSLLLALLTYNQLLMRQRQLQEWRSKARLSRMLKNANDSIIELDVHGRVVGWNQAAEALFSHTGKGAMGSALDTLIIPEEQRQEFHDLLRRVLAGQSVPHFMTHYQGAEGNALYVDITAFPASDDQEQPSGVVMIIHDVTQQQEAERRIRELNSNLEVEVKRRTAELELAKRDLETIFDAMPSMIGYWDRKLTNRVANKAYQAWFGRDKESMHGMHIRDLLGEEIYQQNLPYIEGALRGERQTFERSIPAPDGQVRHSLAHYLPDIIEGAVQGFYVIVHDVTELTESRLKLESLIRQNHILLSTINQQMLYSVTDSRGYIIEANDNFCQISGYQREELMGETHRKINSGTHTLEFWQHIWQTISSGEAWHGEICNRNKSGELYWVDSVIAPFIGSSGEIERYVSLRIDITQRKRAEAEVNRIATLLHNVLAAATEFSIIATDRDGIITLFNAGSENLLQYRAEEMVGRQTPAIIHCPEEIAARGRELTAMTGMEINGFRVFVHQAEVAGVEEREWTYVRKDGSKVRVSLAVTVLRDHEGRVTGYLGIAQDISERVAYEARLLEAKKSAEEANEAKSNFLANMSHEIRTPMNGIIGLCYMLDKQPMSPGSHDMVGKIQSTSYQLLSIINDILDFSKIEAHRLDLEVIPFDLQEGMENLRSIAWGSMGKKQITLEIGTVPDDMRYLIGDPLRLSQILTNLLSNAIKFTDFGRVDLEIRQLPGTDPEHIKVRFTVRDTGIGIAPDKLDLVFNAFSQADNTISRSHGGTGLGLAICKRLIELMQGSLAVQSTPGQGSTFIVELPFQLDRHKRAADKSQRSASHSDDVNLSLAGLKVLLVDDSELNREVATFMLERAGASVVPAGNGHEAIAALKQAADHFDIVLMDVQMPVLDGYAATRLIREMPVIGHVPILALTAGAMESHRQQALQAGMDGFISKPFEASTLINTVKQHVAAHIRETQLPSGDLALDALIQELRQLFIREKLPAHMKQLRKGIDADTPEPAGIAAMLHKLSGEAGTVGLLELSSKARSLESRMLEGSQELTPHQQAIEALLDMAAGLIHSYRLDKI